MNLQQSSQILEFCSRAGISWENSGTKRKVDALLRFWDRIVSGSAIVYWVTGGSYDLKNNPRQSYFGVKIQDCWTSTIKLLNAKIHKNPELEKSSALHFIRSIVNFFHSDFLAALGWIGCAFFPAYGILRLNIVGLSLTTLIIIIIGFVMSVFFVLSNVVLPELINTSKFLKVLDDIDE